MAVARLRGAIDRARVDRWLAAIDEHPAWRLEDAEFRGFNRHSSSLQGSEVPAIDLGAVAAELAAGVAGRLSRHRLGQALACDLDQCWIRRQWAPGRYPHSHAPHSWHQDGALGFDFLGGGEAEGGLLSMTTCWIALTACGDRAPGLELLDTEIERLLPVDDLADPAIRSRYPDGDFARPVLDPGDALVFGGGVLHHTYVRPGMTNDRTSLELRFFPAAHLPLRLRGDRFLALH